MYTRSLPVEIEMMPIQQDSRKKDLQVDLKNAKEMKEQANGFKEARWGKCYSERNIEKGWRNTSSFYFVQIQPK